jgi:hypothetical protein
MLVTQNAGGRSFCVIKFWFCVITFRLAPDDDDGNE